VDLLNSISGPTTSRLERILFDRVLLGLRKLTDTHKNIRLKTKSVTIKGISSELNDLNPDVKQSLETHVDEACSSTNFAKHWSNKRIAHADLDHRNGTARLEATSRDKVESSLDAIWKVLEFVELTHFKKTPVTHLISHSRYEKHFLRALYLGQKEIESKREREAALLSERKFKELGQLRAREPIFPSWLDRDDPLIE
jgi:hypothetical protein